MGFFSDLKNAAVSVHTKRQSRSYRRLRKDTQKAKLERDKLRILKVVKQEKARAGRDVKKLGRRRGMRLPKLIGNLGEFAKGIPSEAELNKSLFGAPSPKRTKSDDDIARDILK